MELFPENNEPLHNSKSNLRIPLAERIRPQNIDQFIGQRHLLGPDKPLRLIIEKGLTTSIILWGPPGTGKTTLARLITKYHQIHFVEYSAVLSGIKEIKDVINKAEYLRKVKGQSTVLFIDEIHRFNKAQQDAFLPHVEKGTIFLIGATTQNPSFEIIPALLSRTRVFTLECLSNEDITQIIENAFKHPDSGLIEGNINIDTQATIMLSEMSKGDARVAINTIELCVDLIQSESFDGKKIICPELILKALQKRPAYYDKSGENHYNYISAFHKSLRGSDPQAALYWLARMLEGGEDPLYIARRMIRFASEDIGLADPRALTVAIATKEAYQFLGSPEGDLALAHCALFLATSPKSNRVYSAYKKVMKIAKETSHEPVPMHLRNAPTGLMKDLGYGTGYIYDHDMEDGYAGQDFLPDKLTDVVFYIPGKTGFETEIEKRMAWWMQKKKIKNSGKDN